MKKMKKEILYLHQKLHSNYVQMTVAFKEIAQMGHAFVMKDSSLRTAQ